jgi:hypothetical protein
VFLADTVYVMSKSPGRFVVKRQIDLPRPRDLEITYTPQFTDIVHELRGHIGAMRKPAGPARRNEAGRRMNINPGRTLVALVLLVAVLLLWQVVVLGPSTSPSSSSPAPGICAQFCRVQGPAARRRPGRPSGSRCWALASPSWWACCWAS